MSEKVFPAMQRLVDALRQAQKVTLQISQALQAAEADAAAPFRSHGPLSFDDRMQYLGGGKPLYAMANQGTAPAGPPPVPVPGDPANEWKWNPNPQNRRGGAWGPKRPIPGQGQSSGSWDPEGHWDIDDGKGNRQRYNEKGEPVTPEDAHQNKPTTTPSKITISDDLLKKMAAITGLTGTALIIYIIVSEGSRVLFPPRNLIPLP